MTKLIDSIIFKFKKIMKGIRYIRYFPKVSSNKLTRFSTWDAELGWCPKPGMQKKDSVSKGVLKGDPPFWTIDKIGSRITSRSKNTKNNTFSIYGDSFAMSREVCDNETIAWQLGDTYDTYCANYGVGNYGLDQSLLRLERCIENDRTSFVCIIVCVATMARTVSIYKHWLEKGNIFGVKPRAYIDDNGKLSFLPNPVKNKGEIKYLYRQKKILTKWDGNYQYFKNNRFNIFGNKAQNYSLQIWADESELFYALMNRFNNLSGKYNFSPMFVLLAGKGVAKKRISGQVLQYQNVIEKASLKFSDISFIDLTLDLYKKIDIDDAYVASGGGHFSPDANRVIAQLIGDKAFRNL
mgnify:FL=1